MASGRKAETTKLGVSTRLLIFRSTATLQIMYALLAGEAPVLQHVNHLGKGIARRQVQVSSLVSAVVVDGHPHGGGELLGHGPHRVEEVIAVAEAGESDVALSSHARVHLEADGNSCTHLNGSDAGLTIALGEMAVARGV